ncbi:MAG: hypothetical protein ACI3U2_02010 [Anaerovibrio sp.]
MITSIKDICAVRGVSVQDTVYENSSQEVLDFKVLSGDFYDFADTGDGKKILRYKNCLDILDFAMIKEQLPLIANIQYSKRESFPYFSAGLAEIKQKITMGEQVAVEGGPCLFGTNEVMIEVVRKDGRKDYFDYNTGKSYLGEDQEGNELDFVGFIRLHGLEIKAVHFENRKAGLTPQEWAFIKYPFEIARELAAPLVIPIPDMSYAKYLTAVLQDVEEVVRKEALAEFRAVGYAISDLYLDLIAQMKALHQNVRCEVVHERDKEICQKYYEARTPYMSRTKVARNLTGIPEKFESVKDYVSMPALPYYLFGINNIIEVDSMDETDSFRKCRRAHKGTINLACILFPELLSTDKVHSIFDAPWDMKEYGQYVVK